MVKAQHHNNWTVKEMSKPINFVELFGKGNKWDIDFLSGKEEETEKKLLRRVVFTLSTSSDSNNDNSHNK